MARDLNLLLALDALLQERSVTRAAERMGLSQPTVSASLGRLRRHFGDELLQRVGNQYQLTPLAERLVDQTTQALSWSDQVFENRADFDPATTTRQFQVIASDAQLPLLGRTLADLAAREAPGATFRFRHSTPEAIGSAQDRLRNVDAMVLPQGILSGFPHLDLYRDHWRCLVWSEDGRAPELDVEELRRRPWVLPYDRMSSMRSVLHRLRSAAGEPHCSVSVENFLVIPHLVVGTDRIGLVPGRVADLAVRSPGIAVARLPFELGLLVETLWWHPMYDLDPGHLWFRDLAARAAGLLDDEPYAG